MVPACAGSRRRSALPGLVVAGLLLVGLVAMHHVAVGAGATSAAPVPHTAGAPAVPNASPGHDHSTLLHLCLAVVAAGAVLLVGALVAWEARQLDPVPAGGPGEVRPAPRAPPPAANRRLAQLCVMRT